MRITPAPASSANVAPIRTSAELRISLIETLPLKISRERHNPEKRNQSQNERHVQEDCFSRGDGIDCCAAGSQNRDEIKGNYAVGQSGAVKDAIALHIRSPTLKDSSRRARRVEPDPVGMGPARGAVIVSESNEV
jgi:hypothetical protein